MAIAVASLGLVSCQPKAGLPSDVLRQPVFARLVSEEPPANPEPLHGDEQVVWSHASSEPGAPACQIFGDAAPALTGRSTLQCAVDLNAADVDELVLELSGTILAPMELRWGFDAASFDGSPDERAPTIRKTPDGLVKSGPYHFSVVDAPEWVGQISWLQMTVHVPRGMTFDLLDFRAVSRRADEARLVRATREPTRLELDSELRAGFVALPKYPLEFDVEVPEDATLAFGVGVESGAEEDVTFTVEVATEREDAGLELFETTLEPGRDTGRWHDARLSLAEWAGQEVELRLRTASGTGNERSVAFWSSPELFAPALEESDQGKNVLFIVLDTLRADHLESYGYAAATSPELTSWSSRSAVRFQNAVVQATWTLPSHVSMFTGLDPLRHAVNYNAAMPESFDSVAEQLRGAGYTTAAITGGGYLQPAFGLQQGFDHYRYWPNTMAAEELESGFGHLTDWLEQNGHRRFFLFFQTYEVHYPHRRRQPWFRQLGGETPEQANLAGIQMRVAPRKDDTWPGEVLIAIDRDGRDLGSSMKKASSSPLACTTVRSLTSITSSGCSSSSSIGSGSVTTPSWW